MENLRTVLIIVLIAVCAIGIIVILMQEGKSAGLGSIAGAADTYWGKAKGRSMEGRLVKFTKIFVALFFVLAMLLGMEFFM